MQGYSRDEREFQCDSLLVWYALQNFPGDLWISYNSDWQFLHPKVLLPVNGRQDT